MSESEMGTQAQTTAAPPPVHSLRTRAHYPLMLIAGTAALAAAFVVARSEYYQPGSALGYNLGLAGALMMLALLLYPLRKHVRFLFPLGALKHWFRLHMVFGISGPILILLHSKFSFGSLNAGVALSCMLLVAGSGIVGRFIYRRIHHGLYGQRATLKDLHQSVGVAGGEISSVLGHAPLAARHLRDYAAYAQQPASSMLAGAWKFTTLGLRARLTEWRARRALAAQTQAVDRDAAKVLIVNYVRAVQKEAQFSAYERLFSLWHVLHTPFVYMLFISGVVHVIAVHMY